MLGFRCNESNKFTRCDMTFRVLAAKTAPLSQTVLPKRLRSTFIPPAVSRHFEIAPIASTTTKKNWFTILIGKNGVGKSQLLADLADAFSVYRGEFLSRRQKGNPLEVEFFSDGEVRAIYGDLSEPDSHDPFQQQSNFSYPARIIASTITPFDKFRLSRDVIHEKALTMGAERRTSDIYRYAGLRDSNGRTNFQNAIFRAIKGLFLGDIAAEGKNKKLERVFNFLGFLPEITIQYTPLPYSTSQELAALLRSSLTDEEIVEKTDSNFTARRLSSFLQSQNDGRDLLLAALDEFGKESDERRDFRIQISADRSERHLLNMLFALKELRIVIFRDVSLRFLEDRGSLSILDASSGVISMVSGMLGIAAGIADNSLIIIDEPEISLHPEWQDKYLELLYETFSSFSGCHFIIATHSPLIVSDSIPEFSNVVDMSRIHDERSNFYEISGASSDRILATVFGVFGKDNLFIRQEVIKAANAVARGRMSDADFAERIKFLRKVRGELPEASNLARLIADLLAAIRSEQ
jgi:energy-coupling factor transporter ATP-binding protein EcfA2